MKIKKDRKQNDFDLLFKNNPTPMWIYDLSSLAFIEVNNAAVRKYGYSRRQFLSMTLKDIRPEEDILKLLNDVKKKRPKLQNSGFWQHKLKNGKIIDVEISSHTIEYNGHKAVIVMSKDITEQKLAREKLNKLNRIYSFLSYINQIIVRTRNRDELLKKVCRTVVDKGEFVMCWIGMLSEKSNKIKVEASAGLSREYLKKINVDLNARIRSCKPTGLAFKTGKYVVSNNIQADKKMISLRKDAAKYGFNSIAVFPVKMFGKTVGTLNLYSSQNYFFNDEEINLIDELAMDLSFALELLEEERKRIEAEEKLRITKFGIDHSQIAVFQIDETGKITYANQHACKTLGYTYDELLNLSILDIDTTFSFKMWKEHQEKIRKGVVRTIESVHKRKDGIKFPVEVTINYLEYNGKKYSFSFAKDITERKLAEEELKKSEEKYRAIIENSILGFYQTKPDGTILTANKALSNMLGYPSVEELEKVNIAKGGYYNKSDRLLFIKEIEEKGFVSGLEAAWLKANGEKIYIRESARAVYDRKGNILYYEGTVEDITQRKIAEEKLLQSEKNLSITLNSIGDGVISTDSKGHILRMNPKAEELCGWSLDDAKGKPLTNVFNIISVHKRTALENPFDKVIRTKKVVGLSNDTVLISRDGTERYISDSAAPIKDNDGNIDGVVLVFSDVTEAYKSRDNLRKSEDLYRDLVENSDILLCTHDLEGNLLSVNKTACEISGYSSKELLNMNLKDLIVPKYRPYFQDYLTKIKTEGKAKGLMLIQTKKGEFRNWKFNNSLRTEGVDKPIVRGLVRDITEQRRAEKLLHESEEKFRNLVESINEVFYISDKQGKITYCSPNITTATGYTLKEIIGNTFLRLIAPSDRQMVRDFYLEQTKNKIQDTILEFKVRCKNGKILWVEQITHIVRDTLGTVVEYRNVARDITERTKAKEALQQSEEYLRTIIETEPECVKIIDCYGNLLEMNTAGLSMLEANSILEVQNHKLLNFILPEHRIAFGNLHKRVMSGENGTLQFEIIGLKGTRRWLETHAAPLRDATGKVTKLLGVTRDITEHKRIVEELQKSKDELQKFFDEDISADFLVTASGKLLQCNKTFLEMFGFKSKEQAYNFPVENLYPSPSDRIKFLELLKENKKIELYENDFLTIDGRVISVLENVSGIFDAEGKLIKIRGYMVDITNRKRDIEEIKKLSRAVEQSPTSIVITNAEGNIEYVNDKFCSITGYTKNEVIGKKQNFLKSKYYNKKFYENLWNTILSGNTWKGELLNKKKNGEKYWERETISPLINDDGAITHFIAVKEDITEQKRAEKEILLLANSLKSVNECVSITDLNDKIIFINQSFLNTYGYNEEELIGKQMDIVRSTKNSADFVKEILPATLRGSWKGELWNRRKDGSDFLIYLSTRIINDKLGNPLGLVGVATDITQRKQAEEELIKAKELAEQSSKLKDAFIANMSHEIRTPLNGILGYTSLIKETFNQYIRKEDEDLFKGVEDACKRIIRTVELILNYSRLQTGEFPIKPKEIDLSSVCQDVIKEFSLTAKETGIDLSFENNCPDSFILADEYSITHSISNLIDNAIKYTKKGFVKVILSKGNKDEIVLNVKDSGIGMNENYLEHLFEPYRQEAMGYARAYEGVGLGLSLVKKFLDLNNAEILVKSKKGEGTTFTIKFVEKYRVIKA